MLKSNTIKQSCRSKMFALPFLLMGTILQIYGSEARFNESYCKNDSPSSSHSSVCSLAETGSPFMQEKSAADERYLEAEAERGVMLMGQYQQMMLEHHPR